MPPLILELSQKTPKRYVLEQFFKHSLNFEPLTLLQISGLNSKFDYATLCATLIAWGSGYFMDLVFGPTSLHFLLLPAEKPM